MKHDFELDGISHRLRPVTVDDAQFIFDLRSNPAISRFLHSGEESVVGQVDWIEEYFDRPNDYYFVIESLTRFEPVGTVGIYDVDVVDASAEWGRWIVLPGSLAALESAWLTYRCGFELLGLEELFCRTVAENEAVVSFHNSTGLEGEPLPGHFDLGAGPVDAIEHRMSRESWSQVSPRLERLVTRLGAKND